jgi:methyltransferase (TIGR00027 family)
MDGILPPGILSATEDLLLASGVVGARTLRWSKSRRMLSIYEAFDWMLPGQFEAFAHRKAFCEQQVREGIKTGAGQILVLGAGFDTLGWRLAPEFPDVNFFEIDHPATHHLKTKGIEKMGRRNNLFLIGADLGKRQLIDVLGLDSFWDPTAQTVIIAEGLLMYLDSDAVRDLFSQCARIVGSSSRIVFSYIPTGIGGRPDAGPWSGLMLWLQKIVGEPWLWSIRPEALGPFLEATGWKNSNSTGQPETTRKQGVEFYALAFRG